MKNKPLPGRLSVGGAMIAVAPQRGGYVWVVCRHCGGEKKMPAAVFYRTSVRTARRSCGCLSPPPGQTADAIQLMLASGDSPTKIARALCLSYCGVRKHMRNRGLVAATPTRTITTYRHLSAAQRAQAVALAEKTSARYAAERYGVCARSVVRWRNGHIKRVAK